MQPFQSMAIIRTITIITIFYYCTVHLDFLKILGKLVVKYVPTTLNVHFKNKKKKSAKDLPNDTYHSNR